MKKKILSIIMAVLMVSTIMSLMAVSASAVGFSGSDVDDLDEAIDDLDEGETLAVSNKTFEFSDDTGRVFIDGEEDITVNFENVTFVNSSSDPLTDSFFEINVNGVTLNFYNCKFTTMVNGKSVVDWHGSALYVDAKNCTINGHNTTYFDQCGTTKDGGGAIYVTWYGDNCTIKNCRFKDCHIKNEWTQRPSEEGRGAYVYVTQTGCRISNCDFDVDGWKAPAFHAHSCVFSTKSDTIVEMCGPNNKTIDSNTGGIGMLRYRGCNVTNEEPFSAGRDIGSALSEGNLWIVIVVAAVVVIGVVTLVIVKKKKSPALAGAAESDE